MKPFEVGDKVKIPKVKTFGKSIEYYLNELSKLSYKKDYLLINEIDPSTEEVELKPDLYGGVIMATFKLADLEYYEATTPTTTVTVHGNDNWKPEQEQIGWKIDKWFPTSFTKSVLESTYKRDGYHIKVGSQMEEEWSPSEHPDFFSPVYSKGKPIEFTHVIDEQMGCVETTENPCGFQNVRLMCKGYDNRGLDMFYAYNGDTDNGALFLGHFNSGTI